MSDYYLDIETYSTTPEPNLSNDQIIAVTYQQVDSRTGERKGNLNILRSWESSETEMLTRFHRVFSPEDKWHFIPIGCNLSFDFTCLIHRWRKIGIHVSARKLLAEHPYIDIQPILVMFNRGSFRGATLERFAGKRYSGSRIAQWYSTKDYDAIQNYIEDEVDRFLSLYRFLIRTLPSMWLEFAKESGIAS